MSAVSSTCDLAVRKGAVEPIYWQLIEQLRRRVAAGTLAAGQQLPSVRELAATLDVHPMTVSKAYSALEREGVLRRRRGKPMVVAPAAKCPATPADRLERLRPVLARVAEEAAELAIPPMDVIELLRQLIAERRV